ncbi:MAG: MBL fold metallo-hydrolase [Alicyclobacillaceae bacterium]|nr:MBL fold metallo-hydrolase [Alicyclobacillaceae bacterium]
MVESDQSAILIDSGLDKETAKKIDQALCSLGYRPTVILNTHGHADHCGGNHYFQSRYPEIEIFATQHEAHFIEVPFLEPLYLSWGALPFPELRNKFLEAKPSKVTGYLPYEERRFTLRDVCFEIVPLPGHSHGMVGVITPDRVLYCADALFDEETLNKHPLLYYTDIGKALTSLEKLKTINTDAYVLYHGGAYTQIDGLIDQTACRLRETADHLLAVIRGDRPSLGGELKHWANGNAMNLYRG